MFMIFIVSQTKLIEWGWALKRKVTNTGYTERALMISQLRHYFQASQAVHCADVVTTLHF